MPWPKLVSLYLNPTQCSLKKITDTFTHPRHASLAQLVDKH